MSISTIQLSLKKSSIEALMRQGRELATQNVSMEVAQSYSAMVDILRDETIMPVVDVTKTPDVIVEEAYQRLEEEGRTINEGYEIAEDEDTILDDTVSLGADGVADQVVGLDEAIQSLESLRNAARVIYHTPKLRKSKAALESLKRCAAHVLGDLDIPRSKYKKILAKEASLESVHSNIVQILKGAEKLMDHVAENSVTISTESLLNETNADKALSIKKAQVVISDYLNKKRG